MATKITSKTHRDVIRQILNRETAYSLAKYVRSVRNATGRELTKGQVVTCLKHMRNQGQLWFVMIDGKVVGQADAISRKVAA